LLIYNPILLWRDVFQRTRMEYYYKTLIRQNQELLKKNKDSVLIEEKGEQKEGAEVRRFRI
jgi:hypothetical protein